MKDCERIADLQAHSFSRFQTLAQIYESEYGNPLAARYANLDRAFTVVAAAKFCGWPDSVAADSFLSAACEVARDYFCGRYIADLYEHERSEITDPKSSESWFDYVQLGLYFSLASEEVQTVELIANWVQFDMKVDSGVVEVSPAINLLYEHLCGLLRGESLRSDFGELFEASAARKRERPLGEMLIALAEQDQARFTSRLRAFAKGHSGDFNRATMDRIVSREASCLCGTWRMLTGDTLKEFHNTECVHIVMQ